MNSSDYYQPTNPNASPLASSPPPPSAPPDEKPNAAQPAPPPTTSATDDTVTPSTPPASQTVATPVEQAVQQEFTPDIFKQLALKNLSEDEKRKMFEEMAAIIQDRVTLRVMNALSPEDQQKLDEIAGRENNEAELDQFLKEKIPNLDQVAAEETQKFREQIISDTQKALQLAQRFSSSNQQLPVQKEE